MSSIKGYEWKRLKEFYEETPEVEAADVIHKKHPGFSGLWCRFIIATANATMFQDVVTLAHGPVGCTSSARNFLLNHFTLDLGGGPFLYLPCTDMDNMQVVHGGEEKLAEAIRAVDKHYRPPLIIILSCCCPGLTGDDIPGVVEMIQPEVGARLYHFPTPGFEGCWLGKNCEFIMPHFVELMDPPSHVDKNAVNILSNSAEAFSGQSYRRFKRKYPSDADELSRYVEGLGLRLHRVLLGGDYEYLRTAPEAGVNAINCSSWGYNIAWAMKKKFGTLHLKHCMPIGMEATKKWIRELADFTGRQEVAENLIEKEYNEVESIWEECKEAVQGRILIMDCGRNTLQAVSRSLAYVRLAKELDMEAYVFNLHPMELKAKWYDIEYYLGEGINPKCLVGPYAYQDPLNLPDVMKDLGVDRDQVVYFTNDVFPFRKAGSFDPSDGASVDTSIPYRKVKDCPARGVGFRGTQGLARDIMAAVKASRRKSKPTFYGRLYGQSLEFDSK